jgi:hypothetical protein
MEWNGRLCTSQQSNGGFAPTVSNAGFLEGNVAAAAIVATVLVMSIVSNTAIAFSTGILLSPAIVSISALVCMTWHGNS